MRDQIRVGEVQMKIVPFWLRKKYTWAVNFLKKTLLHEISHMVFLFLLFALLMGGLQNALIEGSQVPPEIIISPRKGVQTWVEFVGALLVICVGAWGALFLYKGTSFLQGRIAILCFIAGIILLLLGFILQRLLIIIKLG